jgi:hypothetical protein
MVGAVFVAGVGVGTGDELPPPPPPQAESTNKLMTDIDKRIVEHSFLIR